MFVYMGIFVVICNNCWIGDNEGLSKLEGVG